jgi:peptide deformylase
MKKEDIIKTPHPSLRKRSVRVKVVNDEVREFAQKMIEATLDWEDSRDHEVAVGLAGVQVNELRRIVVLRNNTEDKKDRSFVVLINPEITKTIGDPVEDHEGCLSVANMYGLVKRYPEVKVKALDEHGREFRMRVKGFAAKLIQHEIDHTNGILYIDHIKGEKGKFFRMGDDGKLAPIDDIEIEGNAELWPEDE